MKGFFKLTLGKILIFVILPVFYVQFGVIMCKVCPALGTSCPPCTQPYSLVPLPLAIWSYIKYSSQENILLSLIIGIIASYLLACLIGYILKKMIWKNARS